jgi:hypothetical protein
MVGSVYFPLWKMECRSIIWPSRKDFCSIFKIKNREDFVFHHTFTISEGRWIIHCLRPMQRVKLFNRIQLSGKILSLGRDTLLMSIRIGAGDSLFQSHDRASSVLPNAFRRFGPLIPSGYATGSRGDNDVWPELTRVDGLTIAGRQFRFYEVTMNTVPRWDSNVLGSNL